VHGAPIHPLRRPARAARLALAGVALALSSGSALAQVPADRLRRSRVPAARAVERVVLIGLERAFLCALETALGPWGVALLESGERSPGSSMPSTSLAARAIARAHGARAVIWLGRDPAGFALWVYDAYDDRSVSRTVPEPPFRASVSASLALSVKTTLMMVGFAAEEAPAAEPAIEIDAPARLEPELDATPGAPVPRWQLGARGGVQLGPLDGDARDARYGLALRWSAPALEALDARPWLALELDAGLPLRVSEPELDARVWDAAPALAAGVLLPLGRVWAVGLSGAAALHVTALSGTASPERAHVDDLQANPTLRLGAELQARLGGLSLGLQPSAELWLRAQRYAVDGVAVLEHRRRAFGLALAAWVPLD